MFDDLRLARARFGVTDRDLSVLWALLSFLPGPDLVAKAGLVVFPSNAALSDRTHGMGESSLRRHLAALVAAGLIARHDSPNGKRYARRAANGAIRVAFGFDLAPLLAAVPVIRQAADAARDAAQTLALARERIVLGLRDIRKLAQWADGQGCPLPQRMTDALAALARQLRRRMALDAALALGDAVAALLHAVQDAVESRSEPRKTGGNASHNGHHHTESKAGLLDSGTAERPKEEDGALQVPLSLVVRACPDITLYATAPIRRWRELEGAAHQVRPMMGVSRDAWDEACTVMGDPQAAMVLAAILQRGDRIRSPGGYLRQLTRQAARGRFRPGGMILSLLHGT